MVTSNKGMLYIYEKAERMKVAILLAVQERIGPVRCGSHVASLSLRRPKQV